jgi:uncharacterized protein YvpB
MPYVYASVSSSTSYDIMLADSVNKDRRVARVKVDGVAFSNVSARLSTDASVAAFRVNGDRLGGSSIYSVDLKTGKYTQVAASKTAAESIGAYAWSRAGNTMAFVRAAPAPDPAYADNSYGTIYLYSVGFKAMKLNGSLGRDLLLGFSGDGLGVYVSRLATTGSDALQDIVYLPLNGGEGRVALRSQLGLRFTGCALWTPRGVPGRVACLAEGNSALAASAVPQIDSRPPLALAGGQQSQAASPAYRLSSPGSLGLVVADFGGTPPMLLRHDMEAFPQMAWKPDGNGIIMGGTRSGATWAVDLDGGRHALNTSMRDMKVVTWAADTGGFILGDTPTTRLVSVNYASGKLAATRYVGVAARAGGAVVRLPVPYIHQVRDTAENANGTWACGPTSVVMSLAYFGKLEPWTAQIAGARVNAPSSPVSGTGTITITATPTPRKPVTGADFAPYITNKYSAYGHTYDSMARDPSGNSIAGLYGTICPTGLASWQQMIAVLQWHGLGAQYVSLSWDGIVGALRRGHPVLLGNELTAEGHIVLVIGYTADGNLIVNDPYGNKFSPGYGSNNGSGVLYPWKLVTPRHAVEIIGSRPAVKK